MPPEQQQRTRVETASASKATPMTRVDRVEVIPEESDHRSVRRVKIRTDLRILPTLFCLGFVVALNGSSLGQTRTRGIEKALQMRGQDFSIAAMVYYLPAILFAVPSNLVFHRCRRPAGFIASAVFLCGVCVVGQGVTQSYAGLIACRILLGTFTTAFEAAAVNLLAAYYLGHTLQKRMTLFLATRPVASAFGGLLAFGLSQMDHIADYRAWRWIFIIEGLLTILFGAVSFPFVPDWPDRAMPHSSVEIWRHSSSAHPSCSKHTVAGQGFSKIILRDVIQEPVVYFSALIHSCCTTISTSFAVFLPTVLRSFGWSPDKSNYMTVPVFLTAAVVAVVNGVASDRLKSRYPFCAGPVLVSIVASVIPLANKHLRPGVLYAACILLNAGNFAAQSTAITWLGNNIYGRRHRGIALGFMAGIGNLGFLLGSHIYLDAERPVYTTGHAVSLAVSTLGLLSATSQIWYLSRRQEIISQHTISTQSRYEIDTDDTWVRSESFVPGKAVY